MSEYLFAYGTLRPGLAPEYLATANLLQTVGEGSVRGVLYDLGEFPGAVLDPGSASRIPGTVFQIQKVDTTLPALDAYEGYEPESVEASLFVRVRQEVRLEDGELLPCWIYVYNRQVDHLPTVSHWPIERQ